MKFQLSGFLFFILFVNVSVTAQTKQVQPADQKATKETVRLYQQLHRLQSTATLFGHQDALAYGVNWKYEPGRSDVKELSGEYPAVYGWDLGHLELDSVNNLDGVPFAKMREYIKQGYERGGVITISWHLNSPLNAKSAWDVTPGTVTSILPGGSKHQTYLLFLNRVASFLASLKTKNGTAIPVLFRPFHELTGNWFWWCQNVCTPDEFKQLWHFTFQYLTQTKKLHNLLFVYNTAEFNSKEHFMERYPGNDVVDVVSFDSYQHQNAITEKGNDFIRQVDERLTMLNEVAAATKKVPAFAETGYEMIPQKNWWTEALLPLLKKHNVSYVLVWRNAGLMKETGKMHYYAPYPGHESAADFLKFISDSKIYMEKKIRAENIYQQRK
jgi:hypothetical protein